eukprot:CAMPEP_0113880296 /NCGR_PEP_ID=MMETSP0780_2-20120614/7706_1 /TAXON_ID=652834 /ORGANISM="Palpitomonas bilix" /LENGTH=865 /DNA_ID=CAMNT_0000866955 /DNA_START=238 /DNA_END=2835 /DNA_ORIENTATION=- /assembly_acc=CAM_ASM_000599
MFGGEGPVLVVQPPTARGESEEGSRRSGSTRSGETRSGGGEKSDSVVRSEGGNEGREGGKDGAKRKKDKKGEGSEGEVESETEWRRESRKERRPSQDGSKRDGKGEKGSPALSNSGSRRERSVPPSPIVIVEPSAEEEGEERNTSSPSIAPSSQSPMEKSQRGGHGKGGGKASARTPPTRRTRSPSAASPSAMKSRRERGEGAKKGDSGSEDEIAPSSPLSTPAIAIQQRPATVAEGVRRSPAGGSGSSGLKSPPLPYEGTTWSPARTRRKADDDGGDALRAAAQGLRVSANSSEMGSDESEKKKKKKRRKKKASKPPVLVAIEKLEDECDLYTKKLEEERMRMKKLKVEITAAEDEILKFRLKLKGGQDAMDNQISSKEKAVATLEEKLGQMRAKLNERIKSNKKKREVIDTLRKERILFKMNKDKYMAEKEGMEREMAILISESKEALKARATIKKEMEMLSERAGREQDAFDQEWNVIVEMMQNKRPYDKDYLKNLRAKMRRASVGGADAIVERGDSGGDLTHLGDMSKEEEMALKKRHVKNLWRYAYDKVKKHIQMKKTKICVDAVEKLQKVTGISEIDDLGQEFEEMEEKNVELVTATNNILHEVSRTKQRNNLLREEIAKLKDMTSDDLEVQRGAALHRREAEKRLQRLRVQGDILQHRILSDKRSLASLFMPLLAFAQRLEVPAAFIGESTRTLLQDIGQARRNSVTMQNPELVEKAVDEIVRVIDDKVRMLARATNKGKSRDPSMTSNIELWMDPNATAGGGAGGSGGDERHTSHSLLGDEGSGSGSLVGGRMSFGAGVNGAGYARDKAKYKIDVTKLPTVYGVGGKIEDEEDEEDEDEEVIEPLTSRVWREAKTSQ